MFFYAKKIMYLSLYEQGEKVAGAGFASLQGGGEETHIKVQVRNAGKQQDGIYPVFIIAGEQQSPIGRLELKSGCGVCEKCCPIDLEKICIVQIELCKGRIIANEWKQPELQNEQQKKQIRKPETETFRIEEKPVKNEPVPQKDCEKELQAASVFPDKWEQLKRQYQTIHPFGDEREFISIEPKDFVILRENCQRLVNNSFLLHGFYNYHHLILGRDTQIGTNGNVCFYIGVPGVFFEREKMVAVMFGFEGFEAAGPIETGKFGYYMRKVEI